MIDIAMRVEDEDEEVDDQCGIGLKRNIFNQWIL